MTKFSQSSGQIDVPLYHCTNIDVTNNTHHRWGGGVGGGTRGPLSGEIPSLERCIPFTVYFCSFQTYITSFTHVTLHLLCIYIVHAEYFLIPDDDVLGFWILVFLNSSLRPH